MTRSRGILGNKICWPGHFGCYFVACKLNVQDVLLFFFFFFGHLLVESLGLVGPRRSEIGSLCRCRCILFIFLTSGKLGRSGFPTNSLALVFF